MQIRRPDVVAAGMLAATGLLASAHATGTDPGTGLAVSNNHVNVVIERVADDFTPGVNFFALVDVAVPDEAAVTDVTVTTPGAVLLMEDEDGDGSLWTGEPEFATFAAMKTMLNGQWTVTVTGAAPSTTTFTVDLSTLTDNDLFDTPTLLTPTSGAAGVAADTMITWTPPTGAATADMMFLDIEDENSAVAQEDSNLDGSLSVTDTSWDPPLDLADGSNEFALMYLVTDDSRISGGFNVTNGSIAWGSSPFAPAGYTPDIPLVALGAETIIGFSVGNPCTADIDGNGAVGFSDILTIIGAWGPCPGGCTADLTGDDTVGFADVLVLFGSWGPCP